MKFFFKYLILRQVYFFYKYNLFLLVSKIFLNNIRKKKKSLENINQIVFNENFGLKIYNLKEFSFFYKKKSFINNFSGYFFLFFFAKDLGSFQFLLTNFIEENIEKDKVIIKKKEKI